MNDWNGRGWALLAGLLCGFGNGLQFMGGQAAGYAAADAVQVSFFLLQNAFIYLLFMSTKPCVFHAKFTMLFRILMVSEKIL